MGSVIGCHKYTDFVDNYFSLENYILKNINAIHAVNKSYNIAWQGHIAPNEEFDATPSGDRLLDEFTSINHNETLFDIEDNNEIWMRTPNLQLTDGHPTPALHHKALKDRIVPHLGITLDSSVDEWFKHWQGIAENDIEPVLESNPTFSWRTIYYPIKQAQLPNTKTWYDLWNAKNSCATNGVFDMLRIYKSK